MTNTRRIATQGRLEWNEAAQRYFFVEVDGFDYCGPVDECKGDKTLQAGEQQQLAFNQQLQTMMERQYGLQSAQLAYINSILRPIAENPQGLAPKDLVSLRTSATDTISSETAKAKQAVAATEAARGGGTGLLSGPEAQISEGLAVSSAQEQSRAQNSITQFNESVRQSNFWNAINGLSGTAAQLNPVSYAGAANQGSGALAGLGEAYYNTQQSGWLNAALGGLGAVAGGWASGGFKTPCWIAEALWGEADERTLAVRWWLTREFSKHWYGAALVSFYSVAGERLAALVRAWRPVRWLCDRLFTKALLRADTWLGIICT